MPPSVPGTPSNDPNTPVIAIPRDQFFTLLGTIIAGFIAVIMTLIGVVYWGIDARLKSLEDHFQTAIVAGADVKHLLVTAPTLEQKINETHDAVIRLQDGNARIKEQLSSVQSQIHQIPGVRN
jgi:hypothetical protein